MRNFGSEVRRVARHISGDAELISRAGRLIERLAFDRPAGSEGIRKARSIVAEELRPLGFNSIREEEVTVPIWQSAPSELMVLSSPGDVFPCLQAQFTASGDVSGNLVYLLNGFLEDIENNRENLPGAVALIDLRSISECCGGKYIPIQSRVSAAREAGAVGIVLISSEDIGQPAMEVIGDLETAPIPCVIVSRDSGRLLCKLAECKDTKVRLQTAGQSVIGACANLVADLDCGCSQETVILGAHLDTTHNTPGVLDNLSGVVSMVEIARLLYPFRSTWKRRLRLIAYTAEEIGFMGSRAYVSSHSSELSSIPFVMNFDSLTDATARGTAVMWSPEMRGFISDVFEDAVLDIDVRDFFCMSSDYLPFMLGGVPACRPAAFETPIPPWSHTPDDSIQNFDLNWISQNVQTFGTLLAYILAYDESLPARRLPLDEVRGNLEAEAPFLLDSPWFFVPPQS